MTENFWIVQAAAFIVPMLGIAFLAMLASMLVQARQQLKLRQHQSKEAGAADLLNYAAVVDDGVIVCKDGALMAAWRYRGDDDASSGIEQRELIARHVNAAFAKRGSGWMVHIDAVRNPVPSYSAHGLSHFPDPISRIIDDERRRAFDEIGTLYEGGFTITLTWLPPSLAERRFVELMFDDDKTPTNNKSRTYQLLDVFKTECANFENALSTVFSLERLGSREEITEDGRKIVYDEFLSWLHYCFTGVKQPIVLPDCPMYIDAIIAGQEVWTGTVPRVGRQFVQVVAIEGFPSDSYPGILGDLAELPLEYRWSTRFIFLDQFVASAHLEKFRKKWKQKMRGFWSQVFNTGGGQIDEDAVAMVQDANAALAETASGVVAQGYYTSVIVLMAEDRAMLEDAARFVEKSITARGFAARVETINTMDAFVGALPGHGVQNVRRPLIHTGNLAHLMPTSAIWTGEASAPCPMYPPMAPPLMHCVTTGRTPFRLNVHVRDLGHAIMLGPTRAGKSTHLALLAAQFRRYRGAKVIGFDKGMSMYPICKAVGGQHYDIGGDTGGVAFCPLQFLDSKEDRAWAMEWIDTILQLNGVMTTPHQRNQIGIAVENMHKSGHQTTMTEFVMNIQDTSIRDALKQYTIDGLMGNLLDAKEDGLSFNDCDFVIFEIERLLDMSDKYVIPVLLYLFRRIEKILDGSPVFVPMDEVWVMFQKKVALQKLRDWLKSVAKKNCAIFMATQNLSDAKNSGIMDVITESTAVKIFLPNAYARVPDTAALYSSMGLNDTLIGMIAEAVPKRDYLYVSEKGRRMYQLALGPIAKAFVGATDKKSVASIKALEASHGRQWPLEWLKLRGIDVHDVHFSR